MKNLLPVTLGCLAMLSWIGPAKATCPYTFDTSGIVDGNTASAAPVAGNFNYLKACPVFSGNVGIGASPDGIGAGSNGPILQVGNNTGGSLGFADLVLTNASAASGNILGEIDFGTTGTTAADKRGGLIFSELTADSGSSVTANIGFYTVSAGTFKQVLNLSNSGAIISGSGGSCTLTGGASGGTCFSDARLKDIDGNVTDVLGKIAALQLVDFHWNSLAEKTIGASPMKPQTGFVAQEVSRQFPNLVSTNRNGYDTLDYQTLSLYGLEAIKELKNESDHRAAEIVSLSSRLAEQDRRFARMERSLAAINQKQSEQLQALQRRLDVLERKPGRRTAQNDNTRIP